MCSALYQKVFSWNCFDCSPRQEGEGQGFSVQDRGIQLVQVHTELLGLLFCGQKAIFHGSLPDSPALRMNRMLQLWDYRASASPQASSCALCWRHLCRVFEQWM